MTIYVRASSSAAAMVPELIRQTVRTWTRAVPIYQMQTLQRTVDDALFNERTLALLSAAFGCWPRSSPRSASMACMSYVVSRRTREIGIRLALGAERGTVIGMVLKEVALVTLVGIALGVPAALSLSQLVRSQLFGISPADPLTICPAADPGPGRTSCWLHSGETGVTRAASPSLAIRVEENGGGTCSASAARNRPLQFPSCACRSCPAAEDVPGRAARATRHGRIESTACAVLLLLRRASPSAHRDQLDEVLAVVVCEQLNYRAHRPIQESARGKSPESQASGTAVPACSPSRTSLRASVCCSGSASSVP